MSKVVALLSEPRYADEDRTRKANRTQRSRRLGRTPSTDGWPTANKRRRLAIGCGREDATADMRLVRVPCVIALPSVAMIAAEWARAKRAVMGTSGVGGTGGLGGHSRCGCDWPRRPRHRQRPDARSGGGSGALGRTQAHSQAALRQQSGSNQAAITSNQ